uniref:Uncharacterized protein n=1 Tax=Strombidium inclinatum TaxID=197538 RepID=A0A7S3MYS7_9SPIT|mmetsp:Transcript_22742/g.35018  ORF Transcript_22742/g.35018 Transcript_22742/m.35018 type:complete len:129 (+) Transcript_22742:355-741(+)
MQKYTQKGGVRPFGVICFFAGFQDGQPKLYQTEPSGAYSEWKANAIGRNAGTLREFLQKKWENDMTEDKTVRLGVQTLLEVVEDSENLEICVVKDNKTEIVDEEKLAEIVAQLKKEKEEAEEAKKKYL